VIHDHVFGIILPLLVLRCILLLGFRLTLNPKTEVTVEVVVVQFTERDADFPIIFS
jgi:hypothetical protein